MCPMGPNRTLPSPDAALTEQRRGSAADRDQSCAGGPIEGRSATMRLKVFIGTTLSMMVALSAPALAQEPVPPRGQQARCGPAARAPEGVTSAERRAGHERRRWVERPARDAGIPPIDEPRRSRRCCLGPAQRAAPAGEPAPPAQRPRRAPEPGADTGKKTVIGERLSPLIATVSLGYAYAAVKYSGLVSSDVDGPWLEIAFGTELEKRFRLLLAFTSIESPIRRTQTGELGRGGVSTPKVASGLHSTADPIEPVSLAASAASIVQKMFHAHSLGPRIDFLPLGVQGPYLGLTTALAITQGLDTRVGARCRRTRGRRMAPLSRNQLRHRGRCARSDLFRRQRRHPLRGRAAQRAARSGWLDEQGKRTRAMGRTVPARTRAALTERRRGSGAAGVSPCRPPL